jgi:hypothetical protein
MAKKLIKNFLGTMIGIPLMGASASQVNAMDAGTAKTLAGTAVGLQGVALVAHSSKSTDFFKTKRRKK